MALPVHALHVTFCDRRI